MPGTVRRGAFALALLLAASVAGCRKSSDRTGDEVTEKVRACAGALDQAAGLRGRAAVAALARGCPHACPGLAGWADAADPEAAAEALLGRCDLACSAAARTAWDQATPADRYPALIQACGPAHYRLPGDGAMLSDRWFVLERIGAWLHDQRTDASGRAQAALDSAAERAHFPLPLPARREGLYHLPEADAARPPEAAFYVLVEADSVRAAAVPVARLRGASPELRPVPGGAFPGEPLRSADAAAAYRDLVAMLAHHHQGGIGAEPLVLADRDLPLARVLAAAADLDLSRFWLAVGGHHAQAHPVAFERLTGGLSAAPLIRLEPDHIVVPGETDDVRVAAGDNDKLRSEVEHYAVMHAPLSKVELSAHDGATVAEITDVLDALAAARIEVVLLAPRS